MDDLVLLYDVILQETIDVMADEHKIHDIRNRTSINLNRILILCILIYILHGYAQRRETQMKNAIV